MRNIFLFIRRYFNFLLFLLLQITCIYLIVNYSKYHQAIAGNFSKNITGLVNKRYSDVEYYFHLKRTNDSLVKANEMLYNKLKQNFDIPDSLPHVVIDTMKVDSLETYRKYSYISARVVANAVTSQSNYIVLGKGSADGLKKGMGVIDPNYAVAGIITDVSEDYAVVMSLLHKDSRISGKLKRTGETGTLTWDGKEPNILMLNGIPKSVKMSKGDSVITSGFSTTFPLGILIGRVESIIKDPSATTMRVKLRSFTNFYNLQYVYVINNSEEAAIKQLLDKTRKQQL